MTFVHLATISPSVLATKLIWRALSATALGFCVTSIMALTPVKPGGEQEVKFLPGELQLSAGSAAELARHFPRQDLLEVELVLVTEEYSGDSKHPLPNKAQALERVTSVARLYKAAGFPSSRILTVTKAAYAGRGDLNTVKVLWSGWCRAERRDDCYAEYLNRPTAGASQHE